MIVKKFWVCEKCGCISFTPYVHNGNCNGKTTLQEWVSLKDVPVCNMGKDSQHTCCLFVKKLRGVCRK